MHVTLLYFASLRETVGVDRERCALPAGVDTIGRLRAWLHERGGAWATALGDGRNVRAAIEQVMAGPDTPLVDGAEVAFFPPVTGG